jgi:TPP-dependent pyruvate/acetoin dehydrogenase alpha subunit
MAKVEKKPRAENALGGTSPRVVREMLLIRRFEEKVEERFRAGELPGFRMCIGQEAGPPALRGAEPDDVIA